MVPVWMIAATVLLSGSGEQGVSDQTFAQEVRIILTDTDAPPAALLKKEKPVLIEGFKNPLPILSAATHLDHAVAVGTEGGLFVRWNEGEEFTPLYPADDKYSWAPRKVAAVAFNSLGRLWFGGDQGVGVFDGKQWKLYTGAEGLPYDHFTCATPGENGVIWFGTERGAIRFDGQHWSYRAGERWLPDDHVNGIAVDATGTAWIATPKGISRIERQDMTLEKKAGFFIEQVEARHNRDGYVTDCALSHKGDLNSWFPKITDNDGGYTACHGAAMAFRYAVTKDPADKAIARRCLEACIRLVDIVPESMRGFPARVIIPADWHEPVNEQYGAEYNRRGQESDPFWKAITPRFVKSEDGRFLWKCDTSSDELAAHYFLYAVYYDLAAESEDEKDPIRRVVGEITDHLIRNGYNLVDHDGRPTRWGRFGPDYLLTHEGWEQRGLNSLMVLSFLATAEHMTGDPKYSEAARELREKYHYHINALQPRVTFPPDMVAPWDNDLGLWCYYTLMHYEKDPELLMLYRQSLEHFWLFMSKQKNPLWNLLYGACAKHFKQLAEKGYFDQAFPDNPIYRRNQLQRLTPYDQRLSDTLDTLRGLPLDLIAWEMNNSHRLDVQLDPTPGQQPAYGWSRVDGKTLPIEERGHVRQDRDGFYLDYCEGPEGSGLSEHEGTFYLLPYEVARYHGFFQE